MSFLEGCFSRDIVASVDWCIHPFLFLNSHFLNPALFKKLSLRRPSFHLFHVLFQNSYIVVGLASREWEGTEATVFSFFKMRNCRNCPVSKKLFSSIQMSAHLHPVSQLHLSWSSGSARPFSYYSCSSELSPSVLVLTFNPSIQEAEAGESLSMRPAWSLWQAHTQALWNITFRC